MMIKFSSTILQESTSSTSTRALLLQSACLAYGVLIAINIRWKYLGDVILSLAGKRKAKCLPMIKMKGDEDDDPSKKTKDETAKKQQQRKPIIVLLHGMWHDASWCLYSELQLLLKQRGYTSYSIDLLPGERFLPGFTQNEIVSDIEHTLLSQQEEDNDDNNNDNEYILVGHSQGGLVVQSFLLHGRNPNLIKERIKATVLLGTYPLSLIPPIGKIRKEKRNMYAHYGYLGIACIGRIFNLNYLQHIFLLPTTKPTSTPRLKEYTERILKAPSDGFITMSHFLMMTKKASDDDGEVISTKPTLVLGAEQDIIYYPHLLKDDFDARFPNSTHKVIPNQAHCFMDPVDDAERKNDVKHVLVDWIDEILS